MTSSIVYALGDNDRLNYRNLKTLFQLSRHATMPISIYAYYADNLRLFNFQETFLEIRFQRVAQLSAVKLAEKIGALSETQIIFCRGNVLLKERDLIQLINYVKFEPLVSAQIIRIVRGHRESYFQFGIRLAHFIFNIYLQGKQGAFENRLFGLNKTLLESEPPQIRNQIFHKTLLDAQHETSYKTLAADSIEVCPEPRLHIFATMRKSLYALKFWRTEKKFPAWFTARYLNFSAAQISVWVGTVWGIFDLRILTYSYILALIVSLPFWVQFAGKPKKYFLYRPLLTAWTTICKAWFFALG